MTRTSNALKQLARDYAEATGATYTQALDACRATPTAVVGGIVWQPFLGCPHGSPNLRPHETGLSAAELHKMGKLLAASARALGWPNVRVHEFGDESDIPTALLAQSMLGTFTDAVRMSEDRNVIIVLTENDEARLRYDAFGDAREKTRNLRSRYAEQNTSLFNPATDLSAPTFLIGGEPGTGALWFMDSLIVDELTHGNRDVVFVSHDPTIGTVRSERLHPVRITTPDGGQLVNEVMRAADRYASGGGLMLVVDAYECDALDDPGAVQALCRMYAAPASERGRGRPDVVIRTGHAGAESVSDALDDVVFDRAHTAGSGLIEPEFFGGVRAQELCSIRMGRGYALLETAAKPDGARWVRMPHPDPEIFTPNSLTQKQSGTEKLA